MNQSGVMNQPGIMGQPRFVNQQICGGYSGPIMGQTMMGQQMMEQQPMINQPNMGGNVIIKNRKSKKIWIFFIIFYFVYNAIRFINSEGV